MACSRHRAKFGCSRPQPAHSESHLAKSGPTVWRSSPQRWPASRFGTVPIPTDCGSHSANVGAFYTNDPALCEFDRVLPEVRQSRPRMAQVGAIVTNACRIS